MLRDSCEFRKLYIFTLILICIHNDESLHKSRKHSYTRSKAKLLQHALQLIREPNQGKSHVHSHLACSILSKNAQGISSQR